MSSSGMLRRVAVVRTDVSEKLSASFVRVTRSGELGTMLVAQSVQFPRGLKATEFVLLFDIRMGRGNVVAYFSV
jgi:hypothetical protein